MCIKLTPVFTGFCLLGLVSAPAFAATEAAAPDEQQLIEKLSQQTAALQKQVAQLQKQVKYLKTQQNATAKPEKVNAESISGGIIPGVSNSKTASVRRLGDEPLFISGTPVATAPFLGERSVFNASDLIVSYPSVGTDLLLLQQRQKIYQNYEKNGLPTPSDPMLDLSGGIEAQVIGQRPNSGPRTSNIDLTRAELDTVANINTWATGYMAFVFDNTPQAQGEGPQVSNSNLYLDKGFITIGNLSRTPFYTTIGQIYVPFGRYSSYMLTSSLAKNLGRIQDRALLIGYDNNFGPSELNVSAFAFQGDSYVSNQNKIDNPGADIEYRLNQASWSASIGASVIANIADSIGMQSNGGDTGFQGFSEAEGNEKLQRRVPAYDVHGSIGFGHFSVLGEYVDSLQSFSSQDLSFNDSGAKPYAFNIEAAYNFLVLDKPSSIAVGYGMTQDALALLLPRQRYITAFNISVWKDTTETIEYRHDINYSSGNTATGSGQPVIGGTGGSTDTVTLQIGVYF